MIYLPELIEKLDTQVEEGILDWIDEESSIGCYCFKFPFESNTNGLFQHHTDEALQCVKDTEDWNEDDTELYANFINIFIYHKSDWRRSNDKMTNYGNDYKALRTVDSVISDIRRIYKTAVEVWSASQEKILLATIKAL